jgi:hypothetical protein
MRSIEVHGNLNCRGVSVEEYGKRVQDSMKVVVEIVVARFFHKIDSRKHSSISFDAEPTHGRLKVNDRFAHGLKVKQFRLHTSFIL